MLKQIFREPPVSRCREVEETFLSRKVEINALAFVTIIENRVFDLEFDFNFSRGGSQSLELIENVKKHFLDQTVIKGFQVTSIDERDSKFEFSLASYSDVDLLCYRRGENEIDFEAVFNFFAV